MILKCKRCDNIWNYNGSHPFYASCSRCKTNVPVKSGIKDEVKKDVN